LQVVGSLVLFHSSTDPLPSVLCDRVQGLAAEFMVKMHLPQQHGSFAFSVVRHAYIIVATVREETSDRDGIGSHTLSDVISVVVTEFMVERDDIGSHARPGFHPSNTVNHPNSILECEFLPF
jgi:hypothetical protein